MKIRIDITHLQNLHLIKMEIWNFNNIIICYSYDKMIIISHNYQQFIICTYMNCSEPN